MALEEGISPTARPVEWAWFIQTRLGEAVRDFVEDVAPLKALLSLGLLPVFAMDPADVLAMLSRRSWPGTEWASWQGVYNFVRGDELVYVGRALGTTLRQRINSQVRGTQRDDEWRSAVFQAPATTIVVIPLEKDVGDWSASLEARLHGRLAPTSGRRRS